MLKPPLTHGERSQLRLAAVVGAASMSLPRRWRRPLLAFWVGGWIFSLVRAIQTGEIDDG